MGKSINLIKSHFNINTVKASRLKKILKFDSQCVGSFLLVNRPGKKEAIERDCGGGVR